MKKLNKKLVVATAACAALLVGSISTSLAWLLDKTADVENTFTPKHIDVKLEETSAQSFDIIPGYTYFKNPTVKINTDVDCYVFVKVVGESGVNPYVEYTMENEWHSVGGGETGVYYREVMAGTNTDYSVILNNTVSIPAESVTNQNMPTSQVSLTFTAYAAQMWKTNKPTDTNADDYQEKLNAAKFTPKEAWELAKENNNMYEPSTPAGGDSNGDAGADS